MDLIEMDLNAMRVKAYFSRIVFLSISLLLFHNSAQAVEVFILKQSSGGAYDKIEEGFRSYIEKFGKEEISQIMSFDAEKSLDKARKIINELRRDYKSFFLFSVGVVPTFASRELLSEKMQNPVLFSLVFSPEKLGELPKNFAGILMRANPEELIEKITEKFEIKDIFVPFSYGSKTASAEIVSVSEKFGLNAKRVWVSDTDKTINFISGFKEGALWILPDITIVNIDTIPVILNKAKEVPVIAFSRVFVERGCIFGYEIDLQELGRKAGEISLEIIRKKIDIRQQKFFFPPVKFFARDTLSKE